MTIYSLVILLSQIWTGPLLHVRSSSHMSYGVSGIFNCRKTKDSKRWGPWTCNLCSPQGGSGWGLAPLSCEPGCPSGLESGKQSQHHRYAFLTLGCGLRSGQCQQHGLPRGGTPGPRLPRSRGEGVALADTIAGKKWGSCDSHGWPWENALIATAWEWLMH